MIPLSVKEIRRLCRGELSVAAGAGEVTGVAIDSRRVRPDDLFVAVGRGVKFQKQALEKGAAAVLVPSDAEESLAKLAAAVRSRSQARVVAITGSTGKTSTKDILAALCAPHACLVAAEESFNNELGIPLTLCRIEADTELVVAEIGMRGLGQIEEACGFVRPHIGLITSVGPVHLELLGTIERIAQAKAELLHCLEPGGVGIIPAREPLLEPHLPAAVDLHRFGEGGSSWLVDFEPAGGSSRAVFVVEGEQVELELPLSSRHQLQNTLAALVTYRLLGFPLERAQEGARTIRLSRWRGEQTELAGGGILINDVYNANPVSLAAALEHQADVAAGRRRVAVLGTMAELGRESKVYHRRLGRRAAELGVSALIAVGEEAREYLAEANGVPVREWVPDADKARALVADIVRPGDCILVKGSRVVGLELVAEALEQAAEQ